MAIANGKIIALRGDCGLPLGFRLWGQWEAGLCGLGKAGFAEEIGKNELGLAFGAVLEKSLDYEITCKGRGFVGRGRFFGVGLECLRREFV